MSSKPTFTPYENEADKERVLELPEIRAKPARRNKRH